MPVKFNMGHSLSNGTQDTTIKSLDVLRIIFHLSRRNLACFAETNNERSGKCS